MSDITDAGPRLKAMNDALADNDRLRAEIDRLRLTDAEREAVEQAVAFYQGSGWSASTLRGLLERLSSSPSISGTGKSGETANEPEPAIPPAWLGRPYYVDPPEGWRWGFPKLYDPATDGDMRAWMIRSGYPERLARQDLPCTFTEWTDSGEK